MFFAHVGYTDDIPCALHRDTDVPKNSHWMRVSREEYAELLADGYRVAMAWACTEGESR